MQGVEKEGEIFDDVEEKAAVYDSPNNRFCGGRNVETVIKDDADNGGQGKHRATDLHNAMDTILVGRNMDLQLTVSVLFMRFLK